jgi:hypothetical protein
MTLAGSGLLTTLVHADPTYSVSGTVVIDSVPVSGAQVSMYNQSATTGVDGQYTLNSIPPANYPISVVYHGSQAGIPSNFDIRSSSSVVQVTDNTTANVALTTGMLTATVVDSNGAVAPNVNVSIFGGVFLGGTTQFADGTTGQTYNAQSVSTSADTDSNGVASIPYFPGMTYRVCGNDRSGQCQTITPTGASAAVSFTVAAAGTVSGKLTMNSIPVTNAGVSVGSKASTTDANGDFTIPAQAPGNSYGSSVNYQGSIAGIPNVVIIGSSGGYIKVDGNVTQNMPFTLGSLTVNVVDTNGNKVNNANVSMVGGSVFNTGPYTFTNSADGRSYFATQVSAAANTAPNGVANLPVFAGMGFRVCVNSPSSECRTITVGASDSTTFTVPAQAPPAPTNLAIVSPTRAPVLTWTQNSTSPAATSFNIYRDGTKIGTSITTSYTDNTASDGTHSYYVTALAGAAESSSSTPASAVVDTVRPVISFTAPTSFATPFTSGPIVSVSASDASSGLRTLVIHVYTATNQLLSTCGTATPAQLAAQAMSCDLSSLADGTYYIKAGTFDTAGNNKTINSGNFTISH